MRAVGGDSLEYLPTGRRSAKNRLRNPLESGSRLALFFGISKTGRREEVGGFGQSFTLPAVDASLVLCPCAGRQASVVVNGVEKAAMPLNKP